MTELHQWLKDEAKLDGAKLAKALQICDDNLCETLEDLREQHSAGDLGEMFPQMVLRRKIETALGGDNNVSDATKTMISVSTKHESSRPTAKSQSKGTDLPPGKDYAAFISHKKVSR